MRAGAFAVIFDEQRRVLLCHRRDFDAWNLPGGGVEEGESPWGAAIRETREEVGLEIEIVRLTGLYWKPKTSELVFNFEGRIKSGVPITSDEADAVDYFAVDDVPTNTSHAHMERVREALASAVPIVREQDAPSIRDLFPATGPR